jgi:hypothetical protein
MHGPEMQAPLQILTMLAVMFGGGALAMSLVMPQLFVAAQLQQIAAGSGTASKAGDAGNADPSSDARRVMMAFQTKTILAGALLEGGAFFALIALMLEHHVASLVVAAVLWIAILSRLPSTGNASDWIEERLREIDVQRQRSDR